LVIIIHWHLGKFNMNPASNEYPVCTPFLVSPIKYVVYKRW